MDGLIKIQRVTETEIDRCIKNFKKANKTQKSSKGYLNKRIELIETEWRNYKEHHTKILASYVEDEHKALSYFSQDTFSAVEDRVLEALGNITDILDELDKRSQDNTEKIKPQIQTTTEIQLPKISLPKFTGNYRMWSSFHDLFNSLIHENKALSPVQKLHYLKSNLGGEAEQLIRHLQITEANYEPAWRLLVKRYQNKRALLNAHLKTLFSLPNHTSESTTLLKALVDTSRECLESIKGLQIETENWDPIIIYILTQKLSLETLSLWEATLSKGDDLTEIPSLEEFLEFIEMRFRTLEAVGLARNKHPNKEKHSLSIRQNRPCVPKEGFQPKSCHLCKQGHGLKDCPKFLELNLNDRRSVVQRFSYCYNCLIPGHSVTKCRNKYNCRVCSGRHHTLLHSYSGLQKEIQGAESKGPEMEIQEKSVHTVELISPEKNHVLLATALIVVNNSEGYRISLRALIDQGSEVSLITQSAAQRLQLQGYSTDIHINGLSGSQMAVARRAVQLIVHSRYRTNLQLPVEALVLPKLTGLLPYQRINHQSWTHLKDLFLADPSYFKPGKIDVLLGADIYAQIIEEGIRKGPDGTPLAQHTSLGWVVLGSIEHQKDLKIHKDAVISLHCHCNTDDLLRRFWEMEEGPAQTQMSEEEAKCEQIFQNTFNRRKDGRYVVKLPFNTCDMKPQLGESKNIAVRQLLQIERKLEGNPEIWKQYADFMADYYQQGHMEVVTKEVQGNKPNYLPHHFVVKESSTTTKLRVVFDASRKTSNTKSLNDNLLVGPTVQDDLFSILIRWRKHKIAFTADIKQMYRQILIDMEDTDYQRIVWRSSKDEPILEYRLLTVTYGTSCAPFLATRTLHQLALDEEARFSDASYTLLHDFYVDDVLSGGNTTTEVLSLQKNLKLLLKRGGFELRKWVSNCQEVLDHVSLEEKELNLPLDITKDINIKALGIFWDPAKDIFCYKVADIEYRPPTTKRNLLSNISKIFDPLGWLSPIIITAKILLQVTWVKGIEWDAELPIPLEEQWKDYCCKVKDIEHIQIKRWIRYTSNVKSFELHLFSDASMQAYAACVYARVTTDEDFIYTSLLTAKTKVCPIKPITLPRLELCAALLGAKLVTSVTKALKMPQVKIYGWSDSKIALAWMQSQARQWKQFVANRVAEIQTILPETPWNYVASKENPADCASRGLSPLQLKEHDLWWFGPTWLQEERSLWPSFKTEIDKMDLTIEMNKEIKHVKHCNAVITTDNISSLIERYSSYSKLIRITAYCRRYSNNSKAHSPERKTGHLTVRELQDAEKCLIKLVQKECFNDEVNNLANKKVIKNSSKILNLNPYVDDEGLLRVGGRLQHSNLTHNEKFPIIIPGNHHFTSLLIKDIHKLTLHGGIQLMLNILRKTYWVINARKLTRKVIHSCVTCFRYKAKVRSQLMGNLPTVRVQPNRPFLNTGVDFAGPFEIKAHTGRGRIRTSKAYVAIFICLSTKAVHLEAVSDLSTNAFLAAFKRFVGRRGLCQQMYSDCGTNFIGARRKLSEEYHSSLKAISSELVSALALQKVTWHFIPPASPHFGGLWEAGVRSMKHHLRRIMKNLKLTFEEISTILVQIEACLNSRPLCSLTDDPDDYAALTPGHFLVGDALLTPPENNLLDARISYRTRWQLLQQTYQDFWKRWSSEYLSRLQQRPKWLTKYPNVKTGDLVLIKDENLPPSRWLLGRIEKIHPGSDGLVRVVTLRCKESTIKRPISKICPLPINESETEHQDESDKKE